MIRPTITVTFQHHKLPQLIERAPRAVGAAVNRTLRQIEREAKLECPVDTGRLRSSIHGQMTGPTSGEVGTNVDYAIHVHDGYHTRGGSYVAGRPFLLAAAERAIPGFRRAMIELLKREGLA